MANYDAAITRLLANPPKADRPISVEGVTALLALAEGQQRIKAMESRKRLLDIYNRSASEQVGHVRRELEEIRRSRSWQITGPLRSISRRLRTLIGQS